jgi:hypothetical protein
MIKTPIFIFVRAQAKVKYAKKLVSYLKTNYSIADKKSRLFNPPGRGLRLTNQ